MKIGFLGVAVVAWAISAPSFAADMDLGRHHHRHHYRHSAGDIYLHNYGPADFYPGTDVPPDRVVYPVNGAPYGIYDGFGRYCEQSSASYRGQDGRRHSCN
jgi:hypothetical protein